MADVYLLALLILLGATLYSSVGHGGASGYLAAMAIVGVAPETMKPAALALNILVATIATYRYSRAGYFNFRAFWPFVIGSVPLAFVGGALTLPAATYKYLVGAILLYSAVQLVHSTLGRRESRPEKDVTIPLLPAVFSGGVIGLLSGLTGTGGGIFLSPLLIFTGWAGTKPTSGASAAFILANSIAGLSGNLTSVQYLPQEIPLWTVAAVAGALIGTELGTRRLNNDNVRRALAAVLVVAGLKLIFT